MFENDSLKDYQAAYEAFMTGVNSHAKENKVPAVYYDDFNVSARESISGKTLIGKAFLAVEQGLESLSYFDGLNASMAVEGSELKSIYNNAENKLNNFVTDSTPYFLQMCEAAEVPQNDIPRVMDRLIRTFVAYTNKTISSSFFHQPKSLGETYRSMETLYSPAALGDMSLEEVRPSAEMFGYTMDTFVPDVRIALTVALIKPHKGIINRLVHRRNIKGNAITYQLYNDEFYDLSASKSLSSAIRNGHQHRYNIIALRRNPDPVQANLKPVIVQKAMDLDEENPCIVEDGVLMFDKSINLWDTTLVPEAIGYNKVDYTDLLSEKISVSDVIIEVTRAAYDITEGEGDDAVTTTVEETTEQFKINFTGYAKAAFQQDFTNYNSAELSVSFNIETPMHSTVTTAAGASSEIFSGITQDGTYPLLGLRIAGDVHKQEGDIFCYGQGNFRLVSGNPDATAPLSETVIELVSNLSVSLVGYSIDARYSEENLRKAHMAVRSMTNTVTYDLPQQKGIIADYSIMQDLPEHTLDTAQNTLTLGFDHRDIQMFIKTIRELHDAKGKELGDVNYRQNSKDRSYDRNFISSNMINPISLITELDLNNIKNLRSGDMTGDTRSYVETYFNKLISNLHQYSLLTQMLQPGEQPVYRVLTSTPILENIFGVPHYHNHLSVNEDKLFKPLSLGDATEFTRVLPSGVRLDCVTTSFAYMQDWIMILPYRPNDPASNLNFAHNWDGGDYTVNFTPTDGDGQVHRRVYLAGREWPIVTCPVVGLVHVKGLNTVLPDLGASTNAYINSITNTGVNTIELPTV